MSYEIPITLAMTLLGMLGLLLLFLVTRDDEPRKSKDTLLRAAREAEVQTMQDVEFEEQHAKRLALYEKEKLKPKWFVKAFLVDGTFIRSETFEPFFNGYVSSSEMCAHRHLIKSLTDRMFITEDNSMYNMDIITHMKLEQEK